MGKSVKISDETASKIVNLYIQNKQSCAEISKQTGLSDQIVNRLLKRTGVKIREYSDYHILDRELIGRVVNLYSNGIILSEVSKLVNLTIFKVRKILDAEGIKVRLSGEHLSSKISKEDIDEILKLYKENKSLDFIMKSFHISYPRLSKILKEKGVLTERKASFSTTQEQDDQIVKIYKETALSCSKIAKKLGLKSSIVSKRVACLGLAKEKWGNYFTFDADEKSFILEEYSRGLSTGNIAKNLHVSERRVRKFLKLNVELRAKKGTSKEIESEIVDLYTVKNLKYIDIATKLNLTISNVSSVLRRSGILPDRKRKFTGITPDEENYILEFYTNKKKTVEWIQKQTNIPKERIKKFLTESHLTIKTSGDFNRTPLIDEEKDDLVLLYENKVPLVEIMSSFRIKVQTLFKILSERGCEVRDKKSMFRRANELSEENKSQVLNLIKTGLTVDEIMNLMPDGVSALKVKEFLRNHFKPKNNNATYLWLLRCSPDVAAVKIKELKEKQSIKKKGKNSIFYGKPARNSAGKGWKGWYKGVFFRSLRELSYMLHLDENQIIWESAERKRFVVEYVNYDGGDRTYRPDFFVDNKKLIEIKPVKLHNTPRVMLKATAAIKKYSEMGLAYEVLDFQIDRAKIQKALSEGLVKFYGDFEQKFKDWTPKKSKLC